MYVYYKSIKYLFKDTHIMSPSTSIHFQRHQASIFLV